MPLDTPVGGPPLIRHGPGSARVRLTGRPGAAEGRPGACSVAELGPQFRLEQGAVGAYEVVAQVPDPFDGQRGGRGGVGHGGVPDVAGSSSVAARTTRSLTAT